MLSFFTGPERLGVALSELALLGFCFTACVDREITQTLEIRFYQNGTFLQEQQLRKAALHLRIINDVEIEGYSRHRFG